MKYAPIAQLVEHLTLNQGVQGSSPWWCTIVGAFNGEGPPVPIPNTEVKLTCADNTWLEATREDKSVPTQNHEKLFEKLEKRCWQKSLLVVIYKNRRETACTLKIKQCKKS